MRLERNNMMRRYGAWRGVLTFVLILCLVPLLWSQEDPKNSSKGSNDAKESLDRKSVPANQEDLVGKKPDREENRPGDSKTNAQPVEVKDPTQLPEEMQILLGQDQQAKQPTLKPIPPKLPLVHLKGMVLTEGKSAIAMIEVDGQLMMIREEDEITSTSQGRASLVIRVERISDTEVCLHINPLDRKMILR